MIQARRPSSQWAVGLIPIDRFALAAVPASAKKSIGFSLAFFLCGPGTHTILSPFSGWAPPRIVDLRLDMAAISLVFHVVATQDSFAVIVSR
jgi:hypothetical protein